MPLDDAGFGSPANYQAMLIVPQNLMEHASHRCIRSYWIMVAMDMLVRKLEIAPHQIYLTTAIEVTTGHLIAHKGKTSVMGINIAEYSLEADSAPWFDPERGPVQPHSEYFTPVDVEGVPQDLTCEFPKTTERLISEGHVFDVVLVGSPYNLWLCEADVVKSQATSRVSLRPPSDDAGIGGIAIMIL